MDMSNNVNKGKPIYFKDEVHYIVYESNEILLISKNEDLTKVFSVNKSQVSYKIKSKRK